MKCPRCQHDNSEDLHFCNECGIKLVVPCTKCGFSNPPDSKFCGDCGQCLDQPSEATPRELSFDEKLDKIQRYLPKGLTNKILSQRDKIEGERKQVTVMFCDMEGFTPLVEQVGAEEAYSIMDQVYELLIHKVHDYEGIVNEMTGDGIMALFGAPIALEDAPQKAIRSAYAIHREMTSFSDKLHAEGRDIPPIKMRIGINTGLVVVGTLGNDLRVEFKAVGETVNLASRMERLAEPGSTYVTEDTFKLAEGFFRFEALGKKKVKGKKNLAPVYRVIAPSNRRTRFDVNAERGLTPLVGRDKELGLLLDGFERMKEGRGQMFSIVSEAGVGKSRILYEFRKTVINENVTFLEGKCLSYSKNVAYHPVIDILKSNFNIKETDEEREIKKKIEKGLGILGIDKASTLPYILELLSVKDSGVDKMVASPEGIKNRIIEAVKRIVLHGSAIRPLIMAFEDLHWIDNNSEELLRGLLDSISGVPVFLIVTYRPEYVPTWEAKSFHSQITLNPLSIDDSLTMATHILNATDLDVSLSKFILEKTERVPFYIEEFVKSLKDFNFIKKVKKSYQLVQDSKSLAIPSTIQDVIMARVDSMPEMAKQLLQTGSVIEREFPYQLIREILNLPELELRNILSLLKNTELIYERGLAPQAKYIFKHNLIRQVVYDSILANKKRNLHELIGNAIEKLYKHKIDEYCEALAEHFMASKNFIKAAEYLRLASLKSEKTGLLKQCIKHSKRRVSALESAIQNQEVESEIINARVAMAFYLFHMGYFKRAKEAVAPIREKVLKKGPSNNLALIYLFIGTHCYMIEENYSDSIAYLEKAISISEELNDFVSFGFAYYILGLVLSFNCEFDKANYYFQRLLDLSMAIQCVWRVSIMKSNLSVSAYNYNGKVSLGFETSLESLRLAEENGDVLSKAMAYTSHGTSCYYKGHLREAESYLLEGVSYSNKIDLMTHSALANQWLGHTYYGLGNLSLAKKHYKDAIHMRKQSGLFPSSMVLNKIALARVNIRNNKNKVDVETLYSYANANRLKLYQGCVARLIGEILMHMGNDYYHKATSWIAKAMEADRKNHMKWDLGQDYVLLGELLRLNGSVPEAEQQLKTAISIFEECGAEGWSESIKHRFPLADHLP